MDALKSYRHHYDNGGADYSVTDLIQPVRITLLKKRYKKEILDRPVDPPTEMDSFSGTGLHGIFEANLRDHPDYVIEKRMKDGFLGRDVSGCPDIYYKPTAFMYDIKMTKAWKKIFGTTDEWEQQLNLYAYFLWLKKIPIKGLAVIAWWKNFDIKAMISSPKYPRQPIEEIPLRLWAPKEREDFLYTRLQMLIDAELLEDADLPPCTSEDCWERVSSWALYKLTKAGKKPKKASRVMYSEKDIENWASRMLPKGTKYEIQVRKGSRERCENWCEVQNWCSQYAAYKKEK